MTGIKPRKPYRAAGAQFDSRSVRKWKPNPAPAAAPRERNAAENSVITRVASSTQGSPFPRGAHPI